MEEFTYHNIFETKGIEYLAIIAFFALLIPYWIMLNKQVRINRQIRKALGILTANTLRIPQGLFFNRNHTWAHLEKSGTAKVGIDDLILHITGLVSFKNLKKPGDSIKKGEVMAEIDQQGKTLTLCSPITGSILAVNTSITGEPDTVYDDPFGRGWIYTIKPERWIEETTTCFLASEAVKWSEAELMRFKDFMAESVRKYNPDTSQIILQDGGELMENALAEMPPEVWNDFQKNFLAQ